MAITTKKELEDFLHQIKMRGTRLEGWSFSWRAQHAADEDSAGWNIQCSFERPDADSPTNFGVGYGRKWYIARGSSKESITFTAWLAIQQILTHELHESFIVPVAGEDVRLLDPHKRLEDLAVGSRRI